MASDLTSQTGHGVLLGFCARHVNCLEVQFWQNGGKKRIPLRFRTCISDGRCELGTTIQMVLFRLDK